MLAGCALFYVAFKRACVLIHIALDAIHFSFFITLTIYLQLRHSTQIDADQNSFQPSITLKVQKAEKKKYTRKSLTNERETFPRSYKNKIERDLRIKYRLPARSDISTSIREKLSIYFVVVVVVISLC